MAQPDGKEPPIHAEFRQIMPAPALTAHSPLAFYDLARDSDVSLVIATGEQRIYANIVLIVGVVQPPAGS